MTNRYRRSHLHYIWTIAFFVVVITFQSLCPPGFLRGISTYREYWIENPLFNLRGGGCCFRLFSSHCSFLVFILFNNFQLLLIFFHWVQVLTAWPRDWTHNHHVTKFTNRNTSLVVALLIWWQWLWVQSWVGQHRNTNQLGSCCKASGTENICIGSAFEIVWPFLQQLTWRFCQGARCHL